MKKILFILFTITMFSSCIATKTTLNGNVITYNDNGTILQEWDNVIIGENYNITDIISGENTNKSESAFKSFGLNFYDSNTNKFIILSNAIPYIIQYDVNEEMLFPTNNTTTDGKPSKDELRNSWRALDAEYDSIREQMKGMDKNSDEYKTLKSKRIDIQKKKMDVENLMFKHYNGFIK